MPRLTTMLTLTGARPAASAASMPSSTSATGKSTSFIARNVASSSESSETVTRCRPASARRCAMRASSAPFVVSVTSLMPGSGARRAISSSTPRRTSGSPPVMRSFSTPIAGERARQALDLLEREQLLTAQELELLAEDLLRHAVDAAEVAAVGDRDAQVAHRPGELVEGDGHQQQYRAGRSSLAAWRSRSDSASCRSSRSTTARSSSSATPRPIATRCTSTTSSGARRRSAGASRTA